MFIWIDKRTKQGVGFSRIQSENTDHSSHPIDEPTFKELLVNPNKIRWARLVKDGSGETVRFLLPTPIYVPRILSLNIKSHLDDKKTPTLVLYLDNQHTFSVFSNHALPSTLTLVLCDKSIHNVMRIIPISHTSKRMASTFRDELLREGARTFITGVSPDWTADLVVQDK